MAGIGAAGAAGVGAATFGPMGSAEIVISSGRVSDEQAVANRARAPSAAVMRAVFLRLATDVQYHRTEASGFRILGSAGCLCYEGRPWSPRTGALSTRPSGR